MLIPMKSGFSMTNESCHSEPRHDRGEESLLLNDEILRPVKSGLRMTSQHCHSALDAESIYALDPETSLSRCNRGSG